MPKKIKRRGKFWVYIVECKDGTYYTGYTNDLDKRLKEHNNSYSRGAKYLRGKTPVKLAYAKEYNYYENAVHAEREIKKRTRKEKEAMIEAHRNSLSPRLCPPQISCGNLIEGDKSKRGDGSQKFFIKTFGWPLSTL